MARGWAITILPSDDGTFLTTGSLAKVAVAFTRHLFADAISDAKTERTTG